ncbi:hypothetical protein [Mycobacterium paragordonae]|uniref:Uncharacterized protein n=1 Tax=Mycobacterium paragordonae TaxID=1389713 RepID=A0AAJ1S0Q4_9MYCO|nr:hypothetical protein [Mycobacterium paragordonae]MDP7735118.1 hypothetical protein [Mycobacterium paragordonae]
MTTSDGAARSSHALDDWHAIDSDIRSYLKLSEKWSAAAYSNAWDEAKREFSERFDPDNDDPQEYLYDFLNRMSYLWEVDYLWMLRAGALRDAVTAFEVYAEESAEEALRRFRAIGTGGVAHRLTPFVEKRLLSPSWRNLCRIHEALGSRLETGNVQYIRDLRHLLVHQRGELRTEELRRKFLAETGPRRGGPFDSRDIPLARARVLQMMDDLASVIRTCDAALSKQAIGAEAPTALLSLVGGKRPALTLVESRLGGPGA